MSEPANTTTTPAPISAASPRPSRGPWRLWIVGQLLTTIGAVGFAIFAWTWWWNVDGVTFVGASGPLLNYVLLLTPGDIQGAVPPIVLHTLTILGLLIVPVLWLTKRTKGSVLVLMADVLWVTFVSTLTLKQDPISDVSLVDGLSPQHFRVLSDVRPQVGFWIGLTALGILIIGGLAMIFAMGWSTVRARQASPGRLAEAPARARLVRLPAAGALTLGPILFLISILGMGWTAVNCTDRPLFIGQCHGLTFTGVLHYGISTHTDAFDPIASLFAIPALLVGGAALVLIGLWWWRRLTPGLSLWFTLYLATATFFYLVAYAGTGAIALHSTDLGLQSGVWTAQSGLWVAALGLLISWIALIPLWFRALRPAKTPSAPVTTAPQGN